MFLGLVRNIKEGRGDRYVSCVMILLDHRDLYRRKSGGDEVDDSDERGLRGRGQGAEGKNTLDSHLIPLLGYTKKTLWLYNSEWR